MLDIFQRQVLLVDFLDQLVVFCLAEITDSFKFVLFVFFDWSMVMLYLYNGYPDDLSNIYSMHSSVQFYVSVLRFQVRVRAKVKIIVRVWF